MPAASSICKQGVAQLVCCHYNLSFRAYALGIVYSPGLAGWKELMGLTNQGGGIQMSTEYYFPSQAFRLNSSLCFFEFSEGRMAALFLWLRDTRNFHKVPQFVIVAQVMKPFYQLTVSKS